MKKMIPIVLMAISICTLYGCSKIDNSIENIKNNTTEKLSGVYTTQKTETNKKIENQYDLPADYGSALWFGVTEKNNIIVLCNTDKGYSLYDLQTQKEYAGYEADNKGYFMLEERFLGANKDKFYIYVHMCKEDSITNKRYNSDGKLIGFGRTIAPKDEIEKVIVLDNNLSVVDEYDLNDIFIDTQDEVACEIGIGVADSGIWIANNNHICRYNLDSLKAEKLNSKIDEALENITITQMVISEDDSKVVFLGDLLNAENSQVYGIIDVKTAKVQIGHTKTNYINTLNKSGNIAYITDGEDPDTGKSTGEIICINMDTMEVYEYSVDNLESTKACLDADDKYMIAAYPKDDNNSLTRIRCYDFHTGDVKWEYQAPKGRLINISIVQQNIMLIFFREDGKMHIIQLDLSGGQVEG